MPSSLHDLLKRQLKRLGLNESTPPQTLDEWQQFLAKVSNQYTENDNYIYLVKRSLELSSREVSESNKRLEEAQQVAHLGYWSFNSETKKLVLSTEMRTIFGFGVGINPGYEEVEKLIYPEDFDKFKMILLAKSDCRNLSECDIRFYHYQTKQTRWLQCINYTFDSGDSKNKVFNAIGLDITNRKDLEIKADAMNKQLILTARRAGMADIATSVLHNIGNVLNSINVSIGVVIENLQDANLSKLFKVSKMIIDNQSNLGEYFSNDDKGKLIPTYLISQLDNLSLTYKTMDGELDSINNHIQHIRHIIAAQQNISGVSGVAETVSATEMMSNALQMGGGLLRSDEISIIENYDASVSFIIDRSKLLQVLINLIQNAKESLIESDIRDKRIRLEVKKSTDKKWIYITVEDNGKGIDPDNLDKIFTYGFTTKKIGHGFGLHSCLIIAKELGGSLTVENKGLGKGVIFTLKLPIQSRPNEVNDSKIEQRNDL